MEVHKPALAKAQSVEGAPSLSMAVLPRGFKQLRPGGKRETLMYDPTGYFVVTLDRDAAELVIQHYLPDAAPAHEMRGRSGEGMLLALIRERLVSQMSHAGYLGGELAKAEAALRLDLEYEQDQPLRLKQAS